VSSAEGEKEEGSEEIIFVQQAFDYQITGSRRWEDLAGWEQDEYLLTCFNGEAERQALEKRLDLFDRVASSIADGLLGPFRQYDLQTGTSHFQPESPARVQLILRIRMAMLRDTSLGKRLSIARARQPRGRLRVEKYAEDPILKFYSVGPRGTPGLEILSEDAIGGILGIGPYRGSWNDWDALELHQAREYEAARNERWEREMAASHPSQAPSVTQPAIAPVHSSVDSNGTTRRALPIAPIAVACAMLLWALVPLNPYGYYVLLRWVCSALLVYLAFDAWGRGLSNWSLVLGISALVYNPFIPLALGRPLWSAINVLTVVLLVSFGGAMRARR
jgi:hypothetical protein